MAVTEHRQNNSDNQSKEEGKDQELIQFLVRISLMSPSYHQISITVDNN